MKNFLLLTTIGAMFMVLPVYATAQTQKGLDCTNGSCTYAPLEPIPGVNQSGNVTDFQSLVSGIFRILFSVGALIAVGRLVAGGILYMTSEIVEKKSQAKKWVESSIYGLLLLAGSWLILYTINPNLLTFKLTLPSNSISTFDAQFSPDTSSPSLSPSDTITAVSAICAKNGKTVHAAGTNKDGSTHWECQ